MSTNPFKAFLDVRRRELPFVLLMFLYFFLVIAIFWILKPIKKGLFLGYYDERTFDIGSWSMGGPEAELLAKVGNMLIAIVAMTVFTLLSRKLHRHRLTLIFSVFSILSMVAYMFLLDDPGAGTVWTFYLFGDLFNTLMVATFFAFLNDSVRPEQAKRLYGPIVLGGLVGGWVGSWLADAKIKELGTDQWLMLCAGLTVVIIGAAVIAGRIVERDPPPQPKKTEAETAAAEASQGNPALDGARAVMRSRYLLAIVTIVGLYEIISTILDYQFTSTVVHYVAGDDVGAHIARVYFITNSVALGIQLLLTSFIMKQFGVRVALLVMPLAILGNSIAFLALPLLWVGSLLNTTDNALNYSLNQSAKEALYTPVARDDKYKAKAFIDMFIQRFAKALAVGVALGLEAWFGGFAAIRWLSIFVIVLVAVWLLAASYAGRRFKELTVDETSDV